MLIKTVLLFLHLNTFLNWNNVSHHWICKTKTCKFWELSIGMFQKQSRWVPIGWAFKLPPSNIQSNWAHPPVSLSLSLPTLLYSTPPKPPCPPSTVNFTLKMQIKHNKIKSTHIESTCKTIGKLQRCLFMNQIWPTIYLF